MTPAGGAPPVATARELFAVFTLPALVGGVALQQLAERLDPAAASGDAAFRVVLALCALTGITALHVLVTRRGHRLGALAYALCAAALNTTLLGWSLLSASGGEAAIDRSFASATALLALFTLTFVATPFFRAWRARRAADAAGAPRVPRYDALHGYAWEQTCAALVGAAFAGAVALLVVLATSLFGVVGIDLDEWLLDEVFMVPVACAAAATAAGAVRTRPALPDTTRDLLLALTRLPIVVHLPVVLALLAAASVRDVDSIRRGVSPVVVLLAAAALALAIRSAFAVPAKGPTGDSSANGDAGALTGLAVRLLSATVLPLALVAARALHLRVGPQGWTHDRVVAGAMIGVALAYGLGYALVAAAPRADAALKRVNVACALLVIAVAALLLTPVLDGHRLGARDQVARADGDPDALDLPYLAFESGAAGRAALARIQASDAASEPPLVEDLATLARGSSRWQYEADRDRAERDDGMARALDAGSLVLVRRSGGVTVRIDDPGQIIDADATAAKWATTHLDGDSRRACLEGTLECGVLLSDESPLPGAARVALLALRLGDDRVGLQWLHVPAAGGEWQPLTRWDYPGVTPDTFRAPPAEIDALFDALGRGELPLAERAVPVIELGGSIAVPGRPRVLETGVPGE